MVDKKITINVDNSDENADWIKRVRDDRAKQKKEEESVDKSEETELEVEEEEQEIDEDLDSIEKLTKWINNQND